MRIASVYDVDQKTFLLKLGKADKKCFLLIESGVRIHLTQYARERTDTVSPFTAKVFCGVPLFIIIFLSFSLFLNSFFHCHFALPFFFLIFSDNSIVPFSFLSLFLFLFSFRLQFHLHFSPLYAFSLLFCSFSFSSSSHTFSQVRGLLSQRVVLSVSALIGDRTVCLRSAGPDAPTLTVELFGMVWKFSLSISVLEMRDERESKTHEHTIHDYMFNLKQRE